MINHRGIILIIHMTLAFPAWGQSTGDPTSPPVVINPKARAELEGIDLTTPPASDDKTDPKSNTLPNLPDRRPRDKTLGRELAHDAKQATRLVDQHRSQSRDSQTFFGAAIAAVTILVLFLGIVLSRLRSANARR